MQPWDHLITYDGVLGLHSELINRFGGDATPSPKTGCVEGSLGAAWNAELYQENEGGQEGLCFAGCLLFYLAMNHCFTDGNKRVAWASCMEAIRCMGLTINATTDEAEEFVLGLITKDGSKATDVSRWLAERLEQLPEAAPLQ